jgi:tetratricopeptide (TPR) repeat protein
MKKKINELRQTLKEFVDQRDFFTMVVKTGEQDMALFLKVLQGIERESPSDLFLIFAHDAKTHGEYVDRILANLEVQIDGANELKEKEGVEKWPVLPSVCLNTNNDPDTRLASAMAHVRQLFPLEDDNRIIWGFLPLSLENPAAYHQAVRRFLAKEPEPWMRGQRILVRDERSNPFLAEWLAENPSDLVAVHELDLSPEAMTSALVDEAQDQEVPPDQRMTALLQLAFLDFAHKRFEQATDKFGVLYNYYAESNQPALQALCLYGHGDILRHSDQVPEAQKRFKQGLALAVPTQNLPIILNLLLAIGDCCLTLGEWEDAEGYFDYANKVAGKSFNVYAKCDALEKRGDAQIKSEKVGEAIESWKTVAELARQFQYHSRRRSSLEKLLPLYKEMEQQEAVDRCYAELDATQRNMAGGDT